MARNQTAVNDGGGHGDQSTPYGVKVVKPTGTSTGTTTKATTTVPGGTALGGGGQQTVTYTKNTSVPAKNQGAATGNANGTFAGGGGTTYKDNDPFANGPTPTNRSSVGYYGAGAYTQDLVAGKQTSPTPVTNPSAPGVEDGANPGSVGYYGTGAYTQDLVTGEQTSPTPVKNPSSPGRGDRPVNGALAAAWEASGHEPVNNPSLGGVDSGSGGLGGIGGLPGGGNPGGGGYGGGSGGGSGGSGGGSGGGGTGSGGGGSTGYTDAQLLAQALSNAGVNMTPYQLPNMQGPNPDWLEHVSTEELRGMLEQLVESQKQQSQNQIDYGVQQGVNELTRAMEDAAPQFQTQRNQISADEARALDNQGLYAEARGDRGGIGQAQYNSIQNTAAQNRRAVNDAQVKLSTDTARQIADLRAKGEFQKADQLLSITQNYLSKLMSLEQWALETNLSVDQFNSQLQQWVDEYNLNVQKYLTDLDLSTAQLTGVFANGQQTLAAQNMLRESLADSGSALLAAGVLPSRQQLQAMGMTEVQAKAYLNKIGK